MARVTIYHNSRCSKSRQTLELLDQRGVEPRVIECLEAPPSAEGIVELLDLLQLQPRELRRSNGPEYREPGLDDRAFSREQLIRTMADTPRPIQRPLLLSRGGTALGRPPERVVEILQ